MQPIRVLIIDRESEFADILTDHLNSWGFAATSVNNAQEAMETLARMSFGVVVLGSEAREQMGVHLLDWIRANHPTPKVILMAGKGTALRTLSGIQHGAFDVLSFPIELGVLCEAIHRAHRHSPTPRSPHS